MPRGVGGLRLVVAAEFPWLDRRDAGAPRSEGVGGLRLVVAADCHGWMPRGRWRTQGVGAPSPPNGQPLPSRFSPLLGSPSRD